MSCHVSPLINSLTFTIGKRFCDNSLFMNLRSITLINHNKIVSIGLRVFTADRINRVKYLHILHFQLYALNYTAQTLTRNWKIYKRWNKFCHQTDLSLFVSEQQNVDHLLWYTIHRDTNYLIILISFSRLNIRLLKLISFSMESV